MMGAFNLRPTCDKMAVLQKVIGLHALNNLPQLVTIHHWSFPKGVSCMDSLRHSPEDPAIIVHAADFACHSKNSDWHLANDPRPHLCDWRIEQS